MRTRAHAMRPLTLFLFCAMATAVLYGVSFDFKITVGVSFALLALSFFLTRSLLNSSFILFVITSQFIFPGKYYSFEIIPSTGIRYELLPNGVLEYYGITTSDIFALLLFANVLLHIFRVRHGRHPHILRLRRNRLLFFLVVSWLSAFTIGVISSATRSFNPVFSLIHVFQYAKLIVAFVSVLYLVRKGALNLNEVASVVSSVIFFQGLMGVVQFFWKIPLVANAQLFTDSYFNREENLTFPRSSGTFLHPNQYGFILLLLLLLTVSRVVAPAYALHRLSFLFGVAGILFSQSRTVWLASLVTAYVLGGYAVRTRHILPIQGTTRHMVTRTVLFLVLSALVIVPRLLLSQYTLEEGGLSLRLRMLLEAGRVLLLSPLLGYGANTNVWAIYSEFPEGYVTDFPYAVHVAYVQMALEFGVVATLLFFLPLVLIVYSLFVRIQGAAAHQRLLLMGNVLSLVTVFVYYTIQPHAGRIEFPFLGLAAGVGMLSLKRAPPR